MDPTNKVSNLINYLTNDEDKRQELWVYYLSGNPPATFASYLDDINKEYSADLGLQRMVYQIVENPPSDKFYELLNRFSNIERSIMCLLVLGLTVDQVSKYKRISDIRIRQVISIVKENNCWEELYGIKEETNERRAIRS